MLLAVYWAGLFGGFAFDDFSNIVGNRALRVADDSLAGWKAAANSGVAGPMGRGLSMLSFALNYRFFGEAPFSFKLTNLGIHYANALVMGLLARQVLRLAAPAVSPRQVGCVAACAAVIWALHPMNALPVLFVVQRMTSLSALFMLAGLSLYLYGRTTPSRRGLAAIATSILLCLPAAVYSKETGVLFPVYILLAEWLLLGSFKRLPCNTVLPLALVVGVLLGVLCWVNWGIVTSGYRLRDFSLQERLMTEPRVLWFYVQQMLLPMPQAFGLYLDDIAISRGLLTPWTTLLAIAGWVAVTAWAFGVRRRQPVFAFAVFWFLASHALESTILPLEIAFEHRNYLAGFGLFVWLASLLLPDGTVHQWRLLRVASLLVFVVFCGFVTSLRASQWSDDFSRRQVEVFNHPQSARANYEYAILVLERTFGAGRGSEQAYALVREHLQRAVALDRIGKTALTGLVFLDCAAGKPRDAILHTEWLERFSGTVYNLEDRNFLQSFSPLLVEKKLCLDDRSVTSFIHAAVNNPFADGPARSMLYAAAMDHAVVVVRSMPLALEYAQAAVASDPVTLAPGINLAQLYLRSGKVDLAKQEYIRLLALPVQERDKPGLDHLKNLIEANEHHAPTR